MVENVDIFPLNFDGKTSLKIEYENIETFSCYKIKKWMSGAVRGGQWAAAGGLRVICDEDSLHHSERQNCHCVCVSGCRVQATVHTTLDRFLNLSLCNISCKKKDWTFGFRLGPLL